MFPLKIEKCKKTLHKLIKEKDKTQDALSDMMERAECETCECLNRQSVKRYAERFENCKSCQSYREIVSLAGKADKYESDIDSYIENEYAQVVFEILSKKKPMLIDTVSNEELCWERVFDNSFDKISKGLRHILVGLVEKPLKYKLKQ